MAKTANTTTLSPSQFVPYIYGVFREDWLAVAEFLNWCACNRPQVHFAFACGDSGWGGGLAPKGAMVPASGTDELFRTKIVVPVETQRIVVGARCVYNASDEGTVRFTVGAAGVTTLTTFTNATNGAFHTATINTSSSGTGELDVIIEAQHTVGSRVDNYIYGVGCWDDVNVVGTLPGPADT